MVYEIKAYDLIMGKSLKALTACHDSSLKFGWIHSSLLLERTTK